MISLRADSDLRKLDPEGLSLIAFHYTSPDAHYVFHLPLRLAEACVPEWIMAQLKCAPWTPRKKRKSQPVKAHRNPDECPLCSAKVDTTGTPRLAHWQQEHPGLDLTLSQVSWVLAHTRTPGQITSKKQFYAAYPPDYRAPDPQEQGTRY